jgi:hypothetical protein
VANIVARGSVIKPYQSTLKYQNYKKDVDPNVHVIMFQAIVKANGITLHEFIINAFIYTLKEMTLD